MPSKTCLPSLILVCRVVAALLLDVTRGEAPFLGAPMTDYDNWKLDSGEKPSRVTKCARCEDNFFDDELADGVCEKCEKEGEE